LTEWPFELVPHGRGATTKELMPGYAFGAGAPDQELDAAGTFRYDPKRKLIGTCQ